MRIGIDGNGGDNSGSEVVEGSLRFAKNNSNTEVVLYLTAARVEEIRQRKNFPDNVALVPSNNEVTASSKGTPKQLIETHIDSSMVQMFNGLRDGSTNGVFTGGATGPFILLASKIIGKISPKVKLVLASEFPSPQKPITLGVDMGGNPQISADNVIKYGILATEYLKQRFGIDVPVGSLNIGTEDQKGENIHQEINELAHAASDGEVFDYLGNVEPRSFLFGERKVIIGKAFDINNSLKSIKGGSDYTLYEIASILLGPKLGPNFAEWIKKRVNKSGGALLLGAKKAIGKGNGDSTAEMIERGVSEVLDYACIDQETGLIAKMADGYNKRHDMYVAAKQKEEA